MSKVQKLLLVLYLTLSAMAYPSVCPLLPSEMSVYAQGYSKGMTTSAVSQSLTKQGSESVFADDVATLVVTPNSDDSGGQGDDDDIRPYTATSTPDSDDSGGQGDDDDIRPYPPTPTPDGADYGGQGDDDDIRPYPPTPTVTPTVIGG